MNELLRGNSPAQQATFHFIVCSEHSFALRPRTKVPDVQLFYNTIFGTEIKHFIQNLFLLIFSEIVRYLLTFL